MDERLLKVGGETPGYNHVHIFQIGAHLGFEANDPMAEGLTNFLELLSDEERQRVHWYFVEPSPVNAKGLVENLKAHSDLCHLKAIQAAIVPDGMRNDDSLKFYAIRDTIDPETGYDRKSGQMLPFWVTQVGSFSRDMVKKTISKTFKQANLDIDDYIEEINVDGRSMTQLVAEQTALYSPAGTPIQPPMMVLIDTEGFDCQIILGIAEDSPYWPQYLLYEFKHCAKDDLEQARKKLEGMGYGIITIDKENDLAIRRL
jgi:hypothetical protein